MAITTSTRRLNRGMRDVALLPGASSPLCSWLMVVLVVAVGMWVGVGVLGVRVGVVELLELVFVTLEMLPASTVTA